MRRPAILWAGMMIFAVGLPQLACGQDDVRVEACGAVDELNAILKDPSTRALYLFQGSKDTLYRIHGTNEPQSIGRAVSSGCIRMLNADVIDLYDRVPTGSRVVVLPSLSPMARLSGSIPASVRNLPGTVSRIW